MPLRRLPHCPEDLAPTVPPANRALMDRGAEVGGIEIKHMRAESRLVHAVGGPECRKSS